MPNVVLPVHCVVDHRSSSGVGKFHILIIIYKNYWFYVSTVVIYILLYKTLGNPLCNGLLLSPQFRLFPCEIDFGCVSNV